MQPYDAPPPAQPVLTVTALNQQVARLLERSFPLCWIGGEVSNFTRAASGHWYFTLKDAQAQVRAVMFRGRAQFADFQPREGDKVEVRALVTLYGPRGDYQLNVEAIRRAGVGSLFEAFLRLKEKLGAEGLFDPERKRALPIFPRRIGIVTSPQAAALRDVLTALRRRAPHVDVILYPAPVQGQGAGERIAAAIASAGRRAEVDLLLLVRGGGAIEDLWSFNEEVVARAIVAAPMPVIAGVGHETDFTIADFAADLRAATPTAAAELAVSPRADWLAGLRGDALDLTRALRRQLADANLSLDHAARRLLSPAAQIAQQRLRLQGLAGALGHALRQPLHAGHLALAHWLGRLQARRPDPRGARQQLADWQRRAAGALPARLQQERARLAALAAQLEMLNPQRTLERGYAIVRDANGQVLRAPAQITAPGRLQLRLAEGSATVAVSAVQTSLLE
ncbi:exodeoxyribonuclease VII large subunit [Massilia sp. TS11]|uniref:exodeoxyribonuclease VII large subunit n=1 Tax=Massilia sp. TS11 TaxID=2908003 RepID=UPI001EDA2918|nr:exodeoxyribonuclease VII large subunit [Massilia sp. TS11]MCG2585551.1 exodeoxyribonuclease VII large subunit [Massilia sp. TS11]